jgi:hypothetical protein
VLHLPLRKYFSRLSPCGGGLYTLIHLSNNERWKEDGTSVDCDDVVIL